MATVSFNGFASGGDVTAKNRCKWCGRKLRKKWRTVVAPYIARWVEGNQHVRGHALVPEFWPSVKIGEPKFGDYGDGHFCGLRCGYEFAVWFADKGHYIKPKKS